MARERTGVKELLAVEDGYRASTDWAAVFRDLKPRGLNEPTLVIGAGAPGRHLRNTNPIESSFGTVRVRTRVTKGADSKTAVLAVGYKLLETTPERWRRSNGHELVADVLAGMKFKDRDQGHRQVHNI